VHAGNGGNGGRTIFRSGTRDVCHHGLFPRAGSQDSLAAVNSNGPNRFRRYRGNARPARQRQSFGQALGDVVLEGVDAGEAALFQRLHFVVDAALFVVERPPASGLCHRE